MERHELLVAYGDDPDSLLPRLFAAADLPAWLPRDRRIGIKPNLVVAKPSSTGATTDPRLVAALIAYLHALGCRDLVILESSWLGDSTARAFRECGYEEISRQTGVPLVDLKHDETDACEAHGLHVEVCRQAREIGFLINLPVIKAHCQTRMTCALKNFKGCIPDAEKRRFHTLGLHRPIAILNTILRTDLVIVDGIVGDLSFEEGGTPARLDRIIVGRDPVLVDAYVASLMGFGPGDIPYIDIAAELGVGCRDLGQARVRQINEPPVAPHSLRPVPCPLPARVRADQACSACLASLRFALRRLEEEDHAERLSDEPICLGQGFRGKTGSGLGIGSCTAGFGRHLPGCPPAAADIVEFLHQKPGKKIP